MTNHRHISSINQLLRNTDKSRRKFHSASKGRDSIPNYKASSEIRSQHEEGISKAKNLLRKINKEKFEREKRRQLQIIKQREAEIAEQMEAERLK